MAAVLVLMIILWMTEALPLAVTALLGPTLCIVRKLGVMNRGERNVVAIAVAEAAGVSPLQPASARRSARASVS